MFEEQQQLHRELEELRASLEVARDPRFAFSPTMDMAPFAAPASSGDRRPETMPFWKAYMTADPSLTEAEARQLAFDDVRGKRGAAAPLVDPVAPGGGAMEEKGVGPAE